MTVVMAKLGELVAPGQNNFVDGPFGSNLQASEYQDSGVPIIRLQNIRPHQFVAKDIKFISRRKADELSRHDYRPGDLVIAKLGDPTGISCTIPDSMRPGRIVADVVRFRGDETRVNHAYLSRFLNSPNARDQLQRGTTGTTRKRINLSKLKSILIPLPPLAEQKRIAGILDAADALRAKRREALAQLDTLLQSTFLDMFGDPVTNPMGFPIRALSEFYINQRDGTKCGPFGSALKKDEFVDSGVPVWNMDNIDPLGRAVLPFRIWITKEKFRELGVYSVIDGDVIISRAGTVGKMCVANSDAGNSIISTNLIRVRFNPELLPIYFVSLMTYYKGRVGRLKTGPDGAFTHMSTGVLDKLRFPYPPMESQRRFAAIVESVEQQKARMRTHLAELDALFASLQFRAFSGTL